MGTPPYHFKSFLLPPAVHYHPDCIAAHIWTNPLYISDAERANYVGKGILNHFGLGATLRSLPFSPILEFAVSFTPDRKQVSKPRQDVMRALMSPG